MAIVDHIEKHGQLQSRRPIDTTKRSPVKFGTPDSYSYTKLAGDE